MSLKDHKIDTSHLSYEALCWQEAQRQKKGCGVMSAKQVFPRSNKGLSWTTERKVDEAEKPDCFITGVLAKDCCHMPSHAADGRSRTSPAGRMKEMGKQQNLLGPIANLAELTFI